MMSKFGEPEQKKGDRFVIVSICPPFTLMKRNSCCFLKLLEKVPVVKTS